jgi:hypothetical protein
MSGGLLCGCTCAALCGLSAVVSSFFTLCFIAVIAGNLHCCILIHIVHFNRQRTHSLLIRSTRYVCSAKQSSSSSDSNSNSSTSNSSNSSSENSCSENSFSIGIIIPESLLKVTTIISLEHLQVVAAVAAVAVVLFRALVACSDVQLAH